VMRTRKAEDRRSLQPGGPKLAGLRGRSADHRHTGQTRDAGC
jgi:hypothetical protein